MNEYKIDCSIHLFYSTLAIVQKVGPIHKKTKYLIALYRLWIFHTNTFYGASCISKFLNVGSLNSQANSDKFCIKYGKKWHSVANSMLDACRNLYNQSSYPNKQRH